ncbi:Exodeoxyribonuclease VII large subunit [Halomicrobium zhouii]|uniref:Exodeoxyribonuclease VII large subunit n=1 Tax=Halomicrobium zhouii TaxID=767519 RepID=A0A1I6L291_9EURY|nr:exodeoxyribonuclease VII large subunit [Halomicrobium zhouii]SFR97566.1 Exodeoxyribonuclease VII large subunit [Halomicrobium zhouii]
MGTESSADPPTDLQSYHDTLDSENITFVDALNDEIAALVQNAPDLDYDYVLGDVSGYGVSSNGHGHFDLVHENATVHCVVYSYKLDTLALDVDDGTQVAVKGDLSYYEAEGQVSIVVDDIVEVGEGTYQQVYAENRRTLEEDGLLDPDTKQPLPELPTRIGIATSAESDARTDAVTSIHERHPGVDIVVQGTSVQGDDAMMSMMSAISELDDDATVDLIVLTRGGGADKHLRVFNETPLCRVIHGTDTPIVVGVGHENDRTLADEVADQRVMTPTEVGEVVPRKDDLKDNLETLSDRLEDAYGRTVTNRVDDYEQALDGAYQQLVSDRLAQLSTDLDHAFETVTRERLTSLQNRLDHAHEQRKQQIIHEQETAEAVEAYETARRRQRIAIAALVLLLLLALGYIITTL